MRQWLLSRHAWPQDSGGNPDPPVNISGPNNQWMVSPHRPLNGDDLRVSVPDFYAAGNITFFLPLLNGQHTLTLFNPTGYGDQPGLTARATLYWYRFVGGFWSVQDSIVVNVTDTDGLKNGGYAVFEFPMTTFSLAAGDLLTFNVQCKKTSPTYLGDILFRTDESYVDSVYPLAVAQVGVMEINGGYQEFYAPATVSVDVNPVYSQITEPTAAWIYVDVWGPIEGTPAPVSVVVHPVTSLIVSPDTGTPAGITVDVGEVYSYDRALNRIVPVDGPEITYDNVALGLSSTFTGGVTWPPAPAPGSAGGLYITAQHSVVFEATQPTIVNGFPVNWTHTERYDDFFYIVGVKVWSTDENDKTDITFFRNAPIKIQSWEMTDPFRDATAAILLPQCTGFDAPWSDMVNETGPTDTWFLRGNVNVDIYIYPCSTTQEVEGEQMVYHPLTGKKTLYVHEWNQGPVWEGFTFSADPSGDGWLLNCQGALYQLDRYYAKPIYPLRPKPIEEMIRRYFDPRRRGLRTKPLWFDTAGYTKVYTDEDQSTFEAQGPRYVPTDIAIGQSWTGYLTRNTGSWSKVLTGYIAQQLGMMVLDESWGEDITTGDQWTITKAAGRVPMMTIRRYKKQATVVAWYGQQGVKPRITQDANQAFNVQFLMGKGQDGTNWTNQVYPLGNKGGTTFAAQEPAYPEAGPDSLYVGGGYQGVDADGNIINNDLLTNYDGYYADRERAKDQWVTENYFQLPDGISQQEGDKIAEGWVNKNSKPGWSGDILIQCDLLTPDGDFYSKYWLQPGDVIVLKGFQGCWEETEGINRFHIARVVVSGTDVTITVDTRFRDLLSIEQGRAQGRDSLTPINALRVGQRTAMIEDLAAPWDNTNGSGIIPRSSKGPIFNGTFPYTDKTEAHKPKNIFRAPYKGPGGSPDYSATSANSYIDSANKLAASTINANTPALYVPICAGANDPNLRWGFLNDILFSNQGTISRTEFQAYDRDGNIAPVEMHVSFYYKTDIDRGSMPMEYDADLNPDSAHNALTPNAFQPLDPETNRPWNNPDQYTGGPSMVTGWGWGGRPGGYSPGEETGALAVPTGAIIDNSPWPYDMTNNGDYRNEGAHSDDTPSKSALSLGVAIYCQLVPEVNMTSEKLTALGFASYSEYRAAYRWVYVRGRCYRAVSIGTGS